MRIALTASLVSPIREAEANGPHSVIVDLARGLAARGHDVEIYAAAGSGRGLPVVEVEVEPRAADAGVRADGSVDEEARAALRDGFERMFEELRSHKPDVLSQHAFDAPAIELAAGLAAVHTLHLPPVDPDVVRVARRTSQALVTVSKSAARDWYAAGTRLPAVIRNGVPYAEAQLGPRDEAPFALVAGRVSPEKGTHVAIRAARAAGLPVRVVGDIYDCDYYARDVAPLLEPGQTVTPLSRPNLMHLMSRAAVVLMPITWNETFGLVAAEAQMSGCPVVAYRRGALPEVVIDGLGSFLVEPDDERALVNAIAPALQLDRARIAAHARDSFGIEALVDRYEALLTSAAERAIAA